MKLNLLFKFNACYLLLLPLFFALLLAGCKKDPILGRLLTMTVAAERVPSNSFGYNLKTFNVKIIGENRGWRALGGGIEGFEYTEGFEYVLKVRAVDIANPPQDGGGSIAYILVKVVSKTKK